MNLSTLGGGVSLSDVSVWSQIVNGSSDSTTTPATTLLVTDSLETNGRFVLYTLAADTIRGNAAASSSSVNGASSGGGKVLWLACGPTCERHVVQGLKKMACSVDVGSNKQQQQPSPPPLKVVSLAQELSELILQEESAETAIQLEAFCKQIYRKVQRWLEECHTQEDGTSKGGPCWILLDDVTTLGSLVGERLAYALIQSLQALLKRVTAAPTKKVGLALLASNGQAKNATANSGTTTATGGGLPTTMPPKWFGAGSAEFTTKYNWQEGLPELADWILDVVPLKGGYTRQAHGRIVVTPNQGTGNGVVVFNYGLTDTKVMAMRLG